MTHEEIVHATHPEMTIAEMDAIGGAAIIYEAHLKGCGMQVNFEYPEVVTFDTPVALTVKRAPGYREPL